MSSVPTENAEMQQKLTEAKHNLAPCNTMKYHEACGKTYKCGKNKHKWHYRKHKLDRELFHQCYIQPIEKENPHSNYILYDFKTWYHSGKHEACFVCAMDMGGNRFCFNTLKCLGAFVKHYRHPKSGIHIFCTQYIRLWWLHTARVLCQTWGAPAVTMRGSRVILMYDNAYQQRWIDSFSFLSMCLAKHKQP